MIYQNNDDIEKSSIDPTYFDPLINATSKSSSLGQNHVESISVIRIAFRYRHRCDIACLDVPVPYKQVPKPCSSWVGLRMLFSWTYRLDSRQLNLDGPLKQRLNELRI